MKLILLGEGCQISWDVEKLNKKKDPTGLFEWFLSAKLTDINFILKKLVNKEKITLTYQDKYQGNLFMDHTDIRTTHFQVATFEETINRRAERMISYIQSDEPILFIRHENPEYTTTLQDINTFVSLIHQINPLCHFKLLLFKTYNIHESIEHPMVYHKETSDRSKLSEWVVSIGNDLLC